mmetsp:Transcript_86491/g.155785  ORF Transcript_86491/g.155785 Transcript_86491/m.155785 type:complete len:402 (-) Transcript_86491:244-1449(-)
MVFGSSAPLLARLCGALLLQHLATGGASEELSCGSGGVGGRRCPAWPTDADEDELAAIQLQRTHPQKVRGRGSTAAANATTAAQFEACSFESDFVKDASKCPEYDGNVTSTLCGSCTGLCQEGQTENTDGSDPSCQPQNTELPEYMEACKAWDYHLSKLGLSWTKPHNYEEYAAKDLFHMCLGPGSISFQKGSNPCMIHQPFQFITGDDISCTANKYIPESAPQSTMTLEYKDLVKKFQQAHHACQNDENSRQYCLVDVKDPSSKSTVKAALSMGHGALKGICGSLTLMRYKPPTAWEPAGCADSGGACHPKNVEGQSIDRQAPKSFLEDFKYIVNLQIDMRSWSGELSAFAYLAPGNAAGNACDVMEVVEVDVSDIDFGKPTKICCQGWGDTAADCPTCS